MESKNSFCTYVGNLGRMSFFEVDDECYPRIINFFCASIVKVVPKGKEEPSIPFMLRKQPLPPHHCLNRA